MKVQKSSFLKANGTKLFAVFAFSMLSVGNVVSGMPIFRIVPIERPLTIYSFPIQNALANSTFYFDVKPYISRIQPEVDFLVTLNCKHTHHTKIGLTEIPRGITRAYDGEGVCPPAPMKLGPNQSCLLRFYVDKSIYTHSLHGGPIVCLSPPHSCYRPSPGQQIDDAVARTPGPTTVKATSLVPNGLTYDESTSTITGKPTKPGVYHFQISASNGAQTADPRDLEIQVSVNPKDKPVFRDNYTIPSAMPEQNYRLNLMELIEPTLGFMTTNQIGFRIDHTEDCPTWLSIDSYDTTLLLGQVPSTDAGKIINVTLIASSNSGGDSAPLTIQIPVAFDPAKKPIIKTGIELTGVAGKAFQNDFRTNISDPAADSSLQIILDKIEPAAPWLSISLFNPTELNGVVPETASGQEYQVSLHANTTTGGSSDVMIVPLKIAINKELTPHFYLDNPQLSLFYVGQAYQHDFVSHEDVYPKYNDIPYSVELAKGYNNPSWLRIEDNKLIADSVPEDLKQTELLFITIKNVPGGQSDVFSLKLFIMN